VFQDLAEARRRIGHFVDFYNFQRPHQGLGGLVPADRYFAAAEDVKKTLAARVAQNALDLARDGKPPEPFYLTGKVGGQSVSLHAEGERLILTRDGAREEVDLVKPLAADGSPPEVLVTPREDPSSRAPGTSPLDALVQSPEWKKQDALKKTLEYLHEHGRGDTFAASLADLREALSDVPRESVDAALRELERMQWFVLGSAADPTKLSERDRAAAIDDPERGLLAYVATDALEEGEDEGGVM